MALYEPQTFHGTSSMVCKVLVVRVMRANRGPVGRSFLRSVQHRKETGHKAH